MIDWDLIPEKIVAIDAYSYFSGGNFYTLNKDAISNQAEHVLRRTDGEDWEVDTLLSVRPSATLDIVNALLKKIQSLDFELDTLKKKIKEENKND